MDASHTREGDTPEVEGPRFVKPSTRLPGLELSGPVFL